MKVRQKLDPLLMSYNIPIDDSEFYVDKDVAFPVMSTLGLADTRENNTSGMSQSRGRGDMLSRGLREDLG